MPPNPNVGATPPGHPLSQEILAAYFESALPEAQLIAISEHLADCAECTQLARETLAGHVTFDEWTPTAHGEAYRKSALVESLRTVATLRRNQGFADRVAAWSRIVADAAITAVGFPSGLRTSRAGSESRVARGIDLREMLPTPFPPLSPVPAITGGGVSGEIRVRGRRTRGGDSSKMPPVPRAPKSSFSVEALGGSRKGFLVRVAGVPAGVRTRGSQRRLLLLVPTRPGLEPRLEEMHWDNQNQVFLVELPGLLSTDYMIAFEPSGLSLR